MDSNLLPSAGSSELGKPFKISDMYKRPGGKFAIFTGACLLGGIAYWFVKSLPVLIAAAANTLVFVAELAAIALLLVVFTSKSFWRTLNLIWFQLNRKVVGAFVKIDPISILENSIGKMREKLEVVNQNVTNLRSVLVSMKSKLAQYQGRQQRNISALKVKTKELDKDGLTDNDVLKIKLKIGNLNNDIAQVEDMINSQKERIQVSEKYLTVMERLKLIAESKIERSDLELRRTKDAYEAAKEQQSALRSINAIMKGDMKGLEEEMAIEHITKTVNDSVAEMESFINDSNGIIENYNLDSAINEDRVKGILAKYAQEDAFASFREDEPEPKKLAASQASGARAAAVPEPRANKYF